MDLLKKFFPHAFKATNLTAFIITLIVYVLIDVVCGFVIGLLAALPIVGIILADYLTKYKTGYCDLDKLPKADIGGVVAWILAFASTYINFFLPSINCVIVAFVVKVIFNKIKK